MARVSHASDSARPCTCLSERHGQKKKERLWSHSKFRVESRRSRERSRALLTHRMSRITRMAYIYIIIYYNIYIYSLLLTYYISHDQGSRSPPWYGPVDPGPRHNVLQYYTTLHYTILYDTIRYDTRQPALHHRGGQLPVPRPGRGGGTTNPKPYICVTLISQCNGMTRHRNGQPRGLCWTLQPDPAAHQPHCLESLNRCAPALIRRHTTAIVCVDEPQSMPKKAFEQAKEQVNMAQMSGKVGVKSSSSP